VVEATMKLRLALLPFYPRKYFADNQTRCMIRTSLPTQTSRQFPRKLAPTTGSLPSATARTRPRGLLLLTCANSISVFWQNWFVDFEQKRLKSSGFTTLDWAYRLAGAPWNLKRIWSASNLAQFCGRASAVKRPAVQPRLIQQYCFCSTNISCARYYRCNEA
jgi:hypothetical protein